MSSRINPVSGNRAVNGSGEPAPEAPKMTVVQNALVQSAFSHLSCPPALEPKKEELIHDAMNLKKIRVDNGLEKVPTFRLDLTNQELRLLDTMFERWALYDRICLYELLALDLYTEIVKLGKYLPKEAMAAIQESFCAEFAISYASICAEKSKDGCPVPLEFVKPGVKSANRRFAISRESTVGSFAKLKETLQQLASTKKRLSSVSSSLNSVMKKFDLMKGLLLHPEGINLLTQFNLLAHKDKLPNVTALNSNSPHKTLEDLIQYVQFLDTSFACGVKKGFLGIQSLILHDLAEQLASAAQKSNLFQAIKQFKREFAPRYLDLHDETEALKNAIKAAGLGKLTPAEYYGQHKTQLTSNKNPQEFASQLFVNLMTIGLTAQFNYDVFEILDEQIMEPLYPGVYIPTSSCLLRFNINFQTALAQVEQLLGQLLGQTERDKNLPHATPTSLSNAQQIVLRTLLKTADLGSFFVPRLLSLPLTDYKQDISKLNSRSLGRFNLHLWLPFLKSVEPCVKLMTQITQELSDRRTIFLGEIEKFLRTVDRAELISHRREWTHFFREFCFQNSLDLCRWTMIAQDIRAISQIHVNLAVVNSEEHLLPEALVDYMELEGIEELFNKLLYPSQNPMHEDLEDKPVRVRARVARVESVPAAAPTPQQEAPQQEAAPREKLESKKNSQQESAPVERASTALFAIRRGEKTRKIMSRLRELGFLPVSKRGSHQKLEGKEGQTVIIPTGGKRKHQKPGTGASIATQANRKN